MWDKDVDRPVCEAREVGFARINSVATSPDGTTYVSTATDSLSC